MTAIRCLLEESACISQHEPGIIQGEKIVLFSEWNNYVSAVAERLKAAGIKPGDRVSIFMANDWKFLVILLGIIRAGAIACPLSTRLPRDAVMERMKIIDSRVLIAYLAAENTGSLGDADVLSPDSLIDKTKASYSGKQHVELDQPAVILFTSGSSGKPRPAVLSYGNLYYNARGANINMRLLSKDRWLLNLPLYHVSGMAILFRCLLSGAAIIVPEMKESLIDSILQYKPSYVSVVPAQLQDLLNDEDVGMIKGVRAFLVGGDAISQSLAATCQERKWPVYLTYGMTEMGSQIATVSNDTPIIKRTTTSGRVLRHRELIVSHDREIWVRGACLFMGYWSDGAIVRPVDEQGWYHTGDLGEIDEEGYLTVIGRIDNQFISGGENIQPEEIEHELIKIDGIERAVVVPVPNNKYGKRPVAFVRADEIAQAAWNARLSATLPGYMIPDAYYLWPEEDESGGIKVSRKALTDIAATYQKRN